MLPFFEEAGASVEEFVAKENIKRFEAQLADCSDEEQRGVLLRLLETERNRLTHILRNPRPTRLGPAVATREDP